MTNWQVYRGDQRGGTHDWFRGAARPPRTGWRPGRVRTILMAMPALCRNLRRALFVAAVCVPATARGQGVPTGPLQEAVRLDVQDVTADARALIQRVIDTSSTPLGPTLGES